jgi:hypothetical protein
MLKLFQCDEREEIKLKRKEFFVKSKLTRLDVKERRKEKRLSISKLSLCDRLFFLLSVVSRSFLFKSSIMIESYQKKIKCKNNI